MLKYLVPVFCSLQLSAAVITFGDKDCLNQACYGGSDPVTGATLQGLSTDAVTFATSGFGHNYPFSPAGGDFAGTDQIFAGSTQTGSHDGYSVDALRLNGPAVFFLDFSSLLSSGTLATLTLGIAADDFQFPAHGQPFTAKINGVVNTVLTAQLNNLNQGGPVVNFFTIGLNPNVDNGSHQITLSIDNLGDGGDGFAVDFLTVGVTTGTSTVPEPSTLLLAGAGLGLAAMLRRRR